MGKNVAVFVDVANIFYAAKAAGVDIDYVTLLKAAIAGRDFVRAYAYTGLDPDNENQRNFHSFLSRHSYKVVSKDIRKYGDGKVKANLDIELVVDLMKTARNLDVAIIVSGDGDFAPAIRAVQEMGVRCEVISFRGNTSSDLIEVADLFTDIVQIAKVDKSSSRSGRRVADDDEDLSMTEVPDKQTEGTGVGRGRGTRGGRTRTRTGEPEPVAASARPASARPASRAGRRPVETAPIESGNGVAAAPISAPSHGGGLVALPGEKLSKTAIAAAARAVEEVEVVSIVDLDLEPEDTDRAESERPEGETEDGQRRRRRRGGRGRGRGRGRGEGVAPAAGEPAREIVATPLVDLDDEEEDEVDEPVGPRGPRPAAFGSVWDSQIGMDRAPAASLSPLDLDDEDEPAIPEYLIAEQRRGSQPVGRDGRRTGGGAPNRGGRGGGYSAAVDRERYGRGGSSGGINRYPDVSARRPEERPRNDDRAPAAPRQDRPRSGDEPWSEVPPELEAMLRAQIAAKPGRGSDNRGSGRPQADRGSGRPPAEVPAETVSAAADADVPAPARRRTTSRKAAEPATPVETVAPAGEAAPRRRAPSRSASAAAGSAASPAEEAAPAAKPAAKAAAKPAAKADSKSVAKPAPRSRAATAATPAADSANASAPVRKPRAPRKVAE